MTLWGAVRCAIAANLSRVRVRAAATSERASTGRGGGPAAQIIFQHNQVAAIPPIPRDDACHDNLFRIGCVSARRLRVGCKRGA
jgi:hypothetical protein